MTSLQMQDKHAGYSSHSIRTDKCTPETDEMYKKAALPGEKVVKIRQGNPLDKSRGPPI